MERREALDHRNAGGTIEAGRFDGARRRLTYRRPAVVPQFSARSRSGEEIGLVEIFAVEQQRCKQSSRPG